MMAKLILEESIPGSLLNIAKKKINVNEKII